MDDETLLARFEDASVPIEQWNHRAHVRTAYLLTRRWPLDQATDRMRAGLTRLNAVHMPPPALDRGYHETLTVAWMRVVAATAAQHGAAETSEAFCDANPHLLARTLMRVFYSRSRLMTWEAKRTFVEPDLTPLPVA